MLEYESCEFFLYWLFEPSDISNFVMSFRVFCSGFSIWSPAPPITKLVCNFPVLLDGLEYVEDKADAVFNDDGRSDCCGLWWWWWRLWWCWCLLLSLAIAFSYSELRKSSTSIDVDIPPGLPASTNLGLYDMFFKSSFCDQENMAILHFTKRIDNKMIHTRDYGWCSLLQLKLGCFLLACYKRLLLLVCS